MSAKSKALNDLLNQSGTQPEFATGIAAETAPQITEAIADRPNVIEPEDAAQITETRNGEFSVEESNSAPSSPGAINWTIGDLVMRVFQAEPDQEFTINAVVATLMQNEPGLNDNLIRYTITELKRKSLIHHVRNQGHFQILKFTKPGEERRFPRLPLLDKPVTKSALKASPADLASDLALLKEASDVITSLSLLVQRNRDVLTQIGKLRSVI